MRAPALVLSLVLGACSGEQPLTEILVAVDTDMEVPGELDALRIDVVGPGGEVRRSTGRLDGPSRLPALLGIAHRGGPLGPIHVTVTGRLDGTDIVQSRAVVDFVPDRVMVLRLWLDRACVGKGCAEDETCRAGACRDQRVDPRDLEEWDGDVERADAGGPPADGGPDGGGCVPVPEECNGRDDDCDEEIDEVFDLMRDPSHCGDCDTSCPEDPPNAAGVCVDGDCTLVCDPGWADCGGEGDGCESLLSAIGTCGACDVACEGSTPYCADVGGSTPECVATCGDELTECSGSCVDTQVSPQHCGGCGVGCPSRPHATAACAGATCGFLCDTGYRDCDADPDNGCESRLRDLGSCGACGASCAPADAVASCATGTCEIVSCAAGQADCNGAIDDGCETDTATSTLHCGRCGNACPDDPPSATAGCSDGRCRLECDPGFADCNGDDEDGCEASLESPDTCGSCGIRCDGSTPVCAGNVAGGFACAADCGGGTLCEGSCVDTDESPLHCGGCGTECPDRQRSTRDCSGGACGFTCDDGWEDCNDLPDDGCEARIGSVSHCGGCGMRCSLSNATPACVEGACVIAGCNDGWADCDDDPATGCEVDTTSNPSHCGACDADCASGSCTDGTCDAVVPDAGPPDAG